MLTHLKSTWQSVRTLPGLLGLLLAIAGLSACTTVPIPYEKSAPDLVEWFKTSPLKSLAVAVNPQPTLKAHPNIMRRRCEMDGGKLQERVTSLNFNDYQTGQFSDSQTLTDLMVCEANGAALWGVTTQVLEPRHLFGSLCSSGCYYGKFKLTYLEAAQASQALARRDEETRRAMEEANECVARLRARREQLRTAPRIGDEVSLGTVIDVRMPMVQLQLRRDLQSKGVQGVQWVNASTLDLATRSCQELGKRVDQEVGK